MRPKPETMKNIPTPVLVVFGLLFLVVAGVAFLEARKDGVPGTVGAAIGGPFTLTDHAGRTVTERDFLGRHMVIFFGYTFCPDVCPTNLATVADALDILGDDLAARIAPVFVSVDPERDTPDLLAQYVGNFHPRMVGLTGSAEQVSAVARAYRVYYAKADQADGDNETYLIDHSAITYLVGPDGSFIRHFPHGITPEAMAEGLRRALRESGPQDGS